MTITTGKIACFTNEGAVCSLQDGTTTTFIVPQEWHSLLEWEFVANGTQYHIINQYAQSSASESQSTDTSKGTKEKETKHIWSEEETKFLISMYETYIPLVQSRKMKAAAMWRNIATDCYEKGIKVDAIQCENRFKTLKRDFLKSKCHNNRTGRDRKGCAFEEELQNLGGKDISEPRAIMGRNGFRQKNEVEESSTIYDDLIQEERESLRVENESTSTSTQSTPSPSTPEEGESTSSIRKERATTAKALLCCNKTLLELNNNLVEKRKALISISEEEKESAKKFREDLLKRKDEKLTILKEILNRK